MPIQGYRTLYKVKYWAWDGSCRCLDENNDVCKTLQTSFVYAFFQEEDLPINFKEVVGRDWDDKIESSEYANDDEIAAFESGWMARYENNNESQGYLA